MNRQSAIRTLAAALMLALGAGAASAAPPVAAPAPATPPAAKPEPLPSYEALDANRDGVVTLPEIDVYSHPLAREVRHCDRDHDNRMTREEHAACERHPMHAQVAAHHAGQPMHARHHKDAPPAKDPAGASRR